LLLGITATAVAQTTTREYGRGFTPGDQPRYRTDRYGRIAEEKPARLVPIVVGVGIINPPQQALVVRGLWVSMAQTHSYGEDGEIVFGKGGEDINPDNPDIQLALYRWVALNPTELPEELPIKCSVCPGSGVIIVYDDPGKKLSFTRQTCRACEGTGRSTERVSYRISCDSSRLPPKGKTPWQTKHEALVASAERGDVTSRLRLARIYKDGYRHLPKDLPKAREMFLGLASDGNLEGLREYAEIVEASAKGDTDKRYAAAINAALIVRMSTDSGPESATESDKPYLDRVEDELLAEAAWDLIESRKLAKEGADLAGLVRAINPVQVSVVTSLVVSKLKSGRSYGSVDVEPLLKSAESLNPDAFAALAHLCETGAVGAARPEAAYVFYSIAAKLRPNVGVSPRLTMLAQSCDMQTVNELIDMFARVRTQKDCPRTFIEAVYNLKS